MAIQPDPSPYGSQTVTGPGWPNVDEEMLAAAAATYEALAAKITGSIVPQQQGQLMKLADVWEGAGAVAATGEASTIIGGHEANAAHAAAIAGKLRAMEATVVKAKMLANTIAQEVQHECEAIAAMPFSNAQELVQSRIKMGLSQNIANVTAHTTELANTLGVPPSMPFPGAPSVPGAKETKDTAEEASKQAGGGSQQAMQMMSQMGSMATQVPTQLGQAVMAVPQQMGQQLQQLSQPLQDLTSMFVREARRIHWVPPACRSPRSPTIRWRVARVREVARAWCGQRRCPAPAEARCRPHRWRIWWAPSP